MQGDAAGIDGGDQGMSIRMLGLGGALGEEVAEGGGFQGRRFRV